MLKSLSQRIIRWQIRKGYLREEDRTVYEYAYELLLNQGINITVAVIIGAVFGDFLTVVLFLVCYIPLRSYAGGYHADTNMGCTVVSGLMICFVCWIMSLEAVSGLYGLYPVCFVLSGLIIFRYAPVQDRNKPLDEVERVRYGIMSRSLWGIETMAGVICFVLKWRYGLVAGVSHFLLFMTLWMGLEKNRRTI